MRTTQRARSQVIFRVDKNYLTNYNLAYIPGYHFQYQTDTHFINSLVNTIKLQFGNSVLEKYGIERRFSSDELIRRIRS